MKSINSQCLDSGLPVFTTELFCHNLTDKQELLGNLIELEQEFNRTSKVAIVHKENLRFYKNFDSRFIKLINSNIDKCVIFAEGKDETFPFPFRQHNSFCIDLQQRNKHIEKINHDHKTKDLLVLVGRNDINRINLVKNLERLGLLGNSFVSVNSPGQPYNCVYKLEEDHADIHKDFYKFCQTPFLPHYSKSKLSVVMETIMVEESYQLSEAIYNPIITEHPFVVLGPVGYLDFLRSHGYVTFDHWIDESYDKEQDINKRISMIANVCDDFLKIDTKKFYKDTEGVRARNREKFYSTKPIFL
tara:strand:+ start:609 stop:1514 length:906 start_codon:yes stop_codon:yes gene_type:complete